MKIPTLHQRLKAKKRGQTLVVGLTWYTEETWAQVKATASDPERFEESFAEWKAMAVSARRDLQRSGVLAIECQIDPQEFFVWCALHEQKNEAAARAEFVSEKMRAAHDAKA